MRLTGAIEPNPGPKASFQYFNFSVFHWNLNNLNIPWLFKD